MSHTRTHVHGFPDGDGIDLDCTDIGDTVCMTPLHEAGPHRPRIGYWFCHDVPGEDARCIGSVHTVPGSRPPVWEESGSLEGGTLTLTPSVNCTLHSATGGHGYVRSGAWVPA